MILFKSLSLRVWNKRSSVVVSGSRKLECMDPFSLLRRKVTEGIHYPFAMVTYGGNFFYTDWRRYEKRSSSTVRVSLLSVNSRALSVVAREAVIAVGRQDGTEVEEFLPQRRSRTYGIAVTYPQCPQGQNHMATASYSSHV